MLACLAVTRWAMEECRTGNGPVMIEAFTYRMDAHTTSDDPTRYRMAAEEEHWKLLDPIERVKAHLSRQGLADQDFFDEVAAEADALAARFRAFCVALEKPPPERIFANVYTEPHHAAAGQQRGVPASTWPGSPTALGTAPPRSAVSSDDRSTTTSSGEGAEHGPAVGHGATTPRSS